MQPELVRLAAVRLQPVARETAGRVGIDHVDAALRVGLAGDLLGAHDAAALDDAAAHGRGQVQRRVPRGDRLVRLAHLAPREELLVRAAHLRAQREQQDARRHAVEPVRGAEVGEVEVAPQPHEHRPRHVRPARDRREEVRLVHDQQVPVAVQHPDLERHLGLDRRVPVEEHEAARLVRRARVHRAAPAVDDLARRDLLGQACGVVREPVAHVVERARVPRDALGVVRQHEARRVEAVAHGEGDHALHGTGASCPGL